MIKHLYGTPNPLYIKWSLQHRPLTVQLFLRLFQNPEPLINLLCPDLHSTHGNSNPLDALLFYRLLWMTCCMHVVSSNLAWAGAAAAFKCHITHIKQETSPPGFLAFMSRLISAKDNCFSCCGGREAAFAITYTFRNLNHLRVMTYTLPANITKEAKPFHQHPDMLKSLIPRGFY